MRALVLIIALAAATPALATSESDVLTCAGIKDNGERLACFDAAAKLIVARGTEIPENYILQRFKKPADK